MVGALIWPERLSHLTHLDTRKGKKKSRKYTDKKRVSWLNYGESSPLAACCSHSGEEDNLCSSEDQ